MSVSDQLSHEHAMRHYDPAVGQLSKALQLAKSSGASAEVIEAMESAMEMVVKRDDFAEDSTTDASPACKKIFDATMAEDWQKLREDGTVTNFLAPRMMTGPLEGQFLKTLVSIHNAKRILDIGMFTGYSAMSMAEALPADGELVSVDINPFLEGYTGNLLKASPHGKKIKIRIGGAMDIMKDMAAAGESFDLIFLDAKKTEYTEYLKIAVDQGLLRPRGTILVDNAFMHGAGYNKEENNASKQFKADLALRTDLHRSLVPLRDGIIIVRRLSDVEGQA